MLNFDGVEIGTRLKVIDNLCAGDEFGVVNLNHYNANSTMAEKRGTIVTVRSFTEGAYREVLEIEEDCWYWRPGMFESIVEDVSLIDLLTERGEISDNNST